MNSPTDPKLDAEELELLAAYDADEFSSVANLAQVIAEHQQYARSTFDKSTHIDIQLSSKDLRKIQTQAVREGLSYQEFISSLLHKFAEGRLIERPQ